MFIGISHLFTKTKDHIAKIRDVKLTGFPDDLEVSRVYNRAAQICALDIVLHQHRMKFSNKLNLLQGRDALHHKILMKYQWPLPVIRSLTLGDCLLALQDELQIESLPDEVSKFLNQIVRRHYSVNFSDYIEAEWDPTLFYEFFEEHEK